MTHMVLEIVHVRHVTRSATRPPAVPGVEIFERALSAQAQTKLSRRRLRLASTRRPPAQRAAAPAADSATASVPVNGREELEVGAAAAGTLGDAEVTVIATAVAPLEVAVLPAESVTTMEWAPGDKLDGIPNVPAPLPLALVVMVPRSTGVECSVTVNTSLTQVPLSEIVIELPAATVVGVTVTVSEHGWAPYWGREAADAVTAPNASGKAPATTANGTTSHLRGFSIGTSWGHRVERLRIHIPTDGANLTHSGPFCPLLCEVDPEL